jgi:hypothetical protein
MSIDQYTVAMSRPMPNPTPFPLRREKSPRGKARMTNETGKGNAELLVVLEAIDLERPIEGPLSFDRSSSSSAACSAAIRCSGVTSVGGTDSIRWRVPVGQVRIRGDHRALPTAPSGAHRSAPERRLRRSRHSSIRGWIAASFSSIRRTNISGTHLPWSGTGIAMVMSSRRML